MIPRSHNALSIILLVQFMTIVGGTLLTIAFLKVYGYPDEPHMRWNAMAVEIRSWGWIAIFIPALWYLIALRSLRSEGEEAFSSNAILVAILATFIMMVFYAYTAVTAGVLHL